MKARATTALQIIVLLGSLGFIFLSDGTILRGSLYQEQEGRLEPSRKMGYFTYLNEDVSVALLVDVELARMRKAEKFIPLAIKLANKGIRTLKVNRQSLQLVDPANEAYTMPGFKAVEAVYNKYSLDAKYYARKVFTEGDMLTSFSTFRKLPCSFFPHPYKDSDLHDVLIENIELPQGSFIEDLIYFPRPKSEAPGQVLRLMLLDSDLESYIDVGFVID